MVGKKAGSSATKMVKFGSTYQAHLGLKGIRLRRPDEGPMPDVDTISF